MTAPDLLEPKRYAYLALSESHCNQVLRVKLLQEHSSKASLQNLVTQLAGRSKKRSKVVERFSVFPGATSHPVKLPGATLHAPQEATNDHGQLGGDEPL